MKLSYALIAGALLAALPVRAVYAPIPEQEQGKDLTFSARAGVSYDSNIFGGSGGAISSDIFEVAPRVDYNASVTDQTFFSGAYELTLDEFSNRPGDKLLDSHLLTLRLAHAFTKATTLDLNDAFMSTRNPQSLLNGVPINADQSYVNNQLDARFETPLGPKIGTEFKARSVYYRYRNAVLGRDLDRIENLYGVAGTYAILPETKLVAEVRHQDVYYRKLGELKNKSSEYAMGGVDYDVAEKLTLSTRLGAEWRHRSDAPDTTAPYAELSAKYDYARKSYLSAGYVYTLDETSDPANYTDEKVNRFFVSVQHALTALIVASGSVDYEPAVLQGRRGTVVQGFQVDVPNLDETTTRVGGALSYVPNKNWTVSLSYDYDHVNSDNPFRNLVRHRVGLNASYTF
ncbi:MAG TPA: outer membrane beta-barrel protein [Opitutaceae bacterium]|nr:outer membrane beta-barrel protein [Opitutaceae bacterium]